MSSILKGIKQLNEVNPHNYDSDWDYQNAVANSGRSRSRSSDSYDAHDAENDAYEMHKRFAATRARKEAEAKAATEKLDELSPQTLASYKKKAGADATASDKAGDFKQGNKRMSGIMQATKKEFANDAKGVAETTGDKPFDKMMTTIKQGTNKQKTADRKEQQKQTQQQARDAFGNMFGGGNPADKLKIREQGVAEGSTGTPPRFLGYILSNSQGKFRDIEEIEDLFDYAYLSDLDLLTIADGADEEGISALKWMTPRMTWLLKNINDKSYLPVIKPLAVDWMKTVAPAIDKYVKDVLNDLDEGVAEGLNTGPQIIYATGPRTQGINDVDLVFKDLRTGKIVAHVVGNNNSLQEFALPGGGGDGGNPPERPPTYEIRMNNSKAPTYVAFGDPNQDSEHKVYKLGPKQPGEQAYYGMGMTLVSKLDWWSFLEKMLGEIMAEDDAIESGLVDRKGDGDLVFVKPQGVAEAGIPFRGVGGAFNRGDDERHDLDVPKQQVWALKVNGKVDGSNVFNSKEQALKQRLSLLAKNPESEIGLVFKNVTNEGSMGAAVSQPPGSTVSAGQRFYKPRHVPNQDELQKQGVAEEKPGLWANIHAKQERIKHGSGERMRKPGSKGAPTADALRKSAVKESSILEGLQQVDEINWKHAAAAGAMALGALGSGHAQAADLSGYNTQYLQQVAQGNHPRPMVNVADAKAELQARMSANSVSGKTPEEAMSDPRYKSDPIFKAEVDRAASIGSAPQAEAPKGFSQEYLQKAADPNRFGRYLVSVEKAQELLNQARSR